MDELKKLANEVRFRERFRGYDYDEVDAYVSSVSKAAAEMKERMDAMHQRVLRAEAAAAESQSAARKPEDVARDDRRLREQHEQLARVLILAQRTADEVGERAEAEARSVVDAARGRAEAIAGEAEKSAASRLREAEEQAVLIVAEAESDAHRIIDDAKREASEEAVTARAGVLREARVLAGAKTDLAREVVVLESRLDDHRRQLRLLWRSLCSLVVEMGLDGGADAVDPDDGLPVVGSAGGDVPPHESSSPASVSAAHGEGPARETASSPLDSEEAEAAPSRSDESGLGMSDPAISSSDEAEESPDMPMPTWRDDVSGRSESRSSSPFRTAPKKPVVEAEAAQPGESAPATTPDRAASSAASRGDRGTVSPPVDDVVAVRESSVDAPDDELARDLVDEPGRLAAARPVVAESAHALRSEPVKLPDADTGVGEGDALTEEVDPVADESDQPDEFVEQLRRVVSGYGSPPEPHDPMAAFFDHREPVPRRRWRRTRR